MAVADPGGGGHWCPPSDIIFLNFIHFFKDN